MLAKLPGRVYASGHVQAVWGTYMHRTLKLQAEVAGERWWEPVRRSHGDQLVDRIATELWAKYDALPKRKGGWLPVPHLGIELGPGTRVTGGTVEVPGLTVAHEGHCRVVSVEEALERGWARRME